jgi:hypothetical protein
MHSGFSGRFRCCVGPDCSAAHETRSAVGHREELGALHRFRPQPRSVLMLHDKARLHVSAVKHGWPVPNGMMPRGRADLTRIASLRPPMILKPADKHHFHDRRAPRLVLAENCRSAVTAAERLPPLAGGWRFSAPSRLSPSAGHDEPATVRAGRRVRTRRGERADSQ